MKQSYSNSKQNQTTTKQANSRSGVKKHTRRIQIKQEGKHKTNKNNCIQQSQLP